MSKKSKRCRDCKKYIVQVEDLSRRQSSNQKFELCHLFINQLPYCYINKYSLEDKYCLLKFVMFDFKEAKIKFKETSNKDNSLIKLYLPSGTYELSENETNDYSNDTALVSINERFAILKFTWEGETLFVNGKEEVIFEFIVEAEYSRITTQILSYTMKIKLS